MHPQRWPIYGRPPPRARPPTKSRFNFLGTLRKPFEASKGTDDEPNAIRPPTGSAKYRASHTGMGSYCDSTAESGPRPGQNTITPSSVPSKTQDDNIDAAESVYYGAGHIPKWGMHPAADTAYIAPASKPSSPASACCARHTPRNVLFATHAASSTSMRTRIVPSAHRRPGVGDRAALERDCPVDHRDHAAAVLRTAEPHPVPPTS